MKYILLLSVIFLLSLIPGSCKKEPICACGVEQPEVNIAWLNNALTKVFNVNVYQFFVVDTEYIEIADFPRPDSGSIIYDCAGNFKCQFGGSLPGDNICHLTYPAEIFLPSYSKKKLIYSKTYTPD